MSKIASSKYKHAVPKANRPEYYTDISVNTETSETSQVIKASRKFIAFPFGTTGLEDIQFLWNWVFGIEALTFHSLSLLSLSLCSPLLWSLCGGLGLSGGGAAAVLNLSEAGGKFSKDLPVVAGHTGPISDLDFSRFDDHLLATGSDDTTVLSPS